MLHAKLADQERKKVQKHVEKRHRTWTKNKTYLTTLEKGELAEIDPALVVTPPKGFEVGYVPLNYRPGH